MLLKWPRGCSHCTRYWTTSTHISSQQGRQTDCVWATPWAEFSIHKLRTTYAM